MVTEHLVQLNPTQLLVEAVSQMVVVVVVGTMLDDWLMFENLVMHVPKIQKIKCACVCKTRKSFTNLLQHEHMICRQTTLAFQSLHPLDQRMNKLYNS